MHAASDRRTDRLKKEGAVALVALLSIATAACGSGSSSDNGALPVASTPANPAAGSTPAGGAAAGQAPAPKVTVVAGVPEVAGHPDATKAFKASSAGCAPTVERDDATVISVFWRCAGQTNATTYDLATQRTLTLADLLTGAYSSHLGSLASAQFRDAGVTGADVSRIVTWYLTPLSLVAIYPAGAMDFPIASLSGYLVQPSPLG